MHLDMGISHRSTAKVNYRAERTNHINDGEQILAGHAEGNILSLNGVGGQGNFNLEAEFPKHRATIGEDNKASVPTSTVGILRVLMDVKTRKNSTQKTVNPCLIRRRKSQAFVHGTFEVAADTDKDKFVAVRGPKSVSGELVDSK
jgi:hypothetical protein